MQIHIVKAISVIKKVAAPILTKHPLSTRLFDWDCLAAGTISIHLTTLVIASTESIQLSPTNYACSFIYKKIHFKNLIMKVSIGADD